MFKCCLQDEDFMANSSQVSKSLLDQSVRLAMETSKILLFVSDRQRKKLIAVGTQSSQLSKNTQLYKVKTAK